MTWARATLADRARALVGSSRDAVTAWTDEIHGRDVRPLPHTQGVHDHRDADRSDSRFARGRAKGARSWSKVVGITWHQTATRDFGPYHPGLLAVPAHIMIHRDGSCSLLHPLTALVWHGHALNGGTVGVEVACRAAGVEGDASTFWRSRDEVARGKSMADLGNEANEAQLAAIPAVMEWVFREVLDHGGSLRANWAHRQGHKSRASDPGSRIWKAVKAAELSTHLPFVDVQDKTLGSGMPIPKEWRT